MNEAPVIRVELPVTDDLVAALAPAIADLLAERQAAPAVDAWLTVDEAATYLRCNRSRIYALTSQGALPVHKDGSRSLFRRSELDQYIANGGARRA